MQLLESSPLGLRAARIGLASSTSPIRITLFPMVHVGEPHFFEAVYCDAFASETVLVEGINSPIVNRLTRAYRWIEGAKQMNLCIQPPYPPATDEHTATIHADLSPGEFSDVWRDVPLWLRLLVYVGAPIVGSRYRWFGTRQLLAEGLSLEDLPSREETLGWSPEAATLTVALLDARDRRLVSVLREQLESMRSGRLAIVYGALHMRAVLNELFRVGYYATDSRWLRVFSIS